MDGLGYAAVVRALGYVLCLALACTDRYPSGSPREVEAAPEPEPVSEAKPAPVPAPARARPIEGPEQPAITPVAPVTAVARGRWMGKPPLRFYKLHMALVNRHDRPIWLVFSSYFDKRLPAPEPPDSSVVRFAGTSSPRVPFGGQGYPQRQREVMQVQLYASPGFHAYHLPPRGRVVLDGVVFDGWSDVDRMDVWEVDDILVNGRQPLEKWLPYPVTARDGAVIRDFEDWENLDWDYATQQGRKNYPQEVVEHVDVKVVRRWVVPIAELGPARH